jgi:hypothetical protein
VVEIIEDEKDAGAECIKFTPYRSKKRQGVTLARWQHPMELADRKGAVPLPGDKLGTLAVIEFQRAVTEAHEHGIRFVWIDDPEGIFPPSERPSFQASHKARNRG